MEGSKGSSSSKLCANSRENIAVVVDALRAQNTNNSQRKSTTRENESRNERNYVDVCPNFPFSFSARFATIQRKKNNMNSRVGCGALTNDGKRRDQRIYFIFQPKCENRVPLFHDWILPFFCSSLTLILLVVHTRKKPQKGQRGCETRNNCSNVDKPRVGERKNFIRSMKINWNEVPIFEDRSMRMSDIDVVRGSEPTSMILTKAISLTLVYVVGCERSMKTNIDRKYPSNSNNLLLLYYVNFWGAEKLECYKNVKQTIVTHRICHGEWIPQVKRYANWNKLKMVLLSNIYSSIHRS